MVNGREGPYLIEASKWPTLTEKRDNERVGGEAGGVENQPPMKEDLMDNMSIPSMEEGSDNDGDSKEWTTSAPKRKARKRNHPVIATRASTRISKTDGPILNKATKRMQWKDEMLGGKSSNPFTVLNNAPSSHLQNVIKDLDLEVVNIDTQIKAFRAEEKVRAALAEANYKCYLEQLKAKEAPQCEEDLGDLAMGIIDNASRGAGALQNPPSATQQAGAKVGKNNSRRKKK